MSKSIRSHFRYYLLTIISVWTAVIIFSLIMNYFKSRNYTIEQALLVAQSSFNKDILYRRWAAGHGGVYVPITESTPPNPYLSHIAERDIVIPSGKRFTLINPAYMTRQTHELGMDVYGVRGHITSLDPIRIENIADAWEVIALESFEIGGKEFSSIEMIDDEPYMRFMRPMITEARCLKCHEDQGYKVGDIRGGISVSVPMTPYWNLLLGKSLTLIFGHFLLWIIGFAGIVLGYQNISKAEEALQQSEKDLRETQRIAHLGNWRLDVATNHVVWSEELYNMYGFDPTLPPPPYTEHMKIFTRESWETLSTSLARTRETGIPYELVLETVRKDGSNGWMWVRGDTEIDSAGNTIGLWGAAQDITERKNLEEQIRIRERMDSIGTLASGIAHDFNNLLAGIMGNLDLLRLENDNFSSDQREYLGESYQLCQKSARLIRNFQSLSSDSLLQSTSVDVNKVAAEIISILKQTTDRLIEKQLDIEMDKYYVAGVFDQLHQVFLNLGTNAIQAIEEKGAQAGDYIKISACDCEPEEEIKRELPKGMFVHITFADTGSGMAEEVKRKAFEPLFTTKARGVQKGQGLGLAMVYNIITRKHNGYIEIESEKGKGTTFHIFLPKAEPKKLSPLSETPSIIGGSETILVIEDEESISNLAKRALTKFGYSVLVASDGSSGLNLYKEHDTIDLVILDLTLQKISGKAVLDGIIGVDPNARIIISSGQSQIELEKHTQAKSFVAKPYKLDDLLSAVRDVLDG